jgi:hypothetical protein
MGQLKLPEGAEAGFRIESNDVFGCTFAINIYGAGKSGWFVASIRFKSSSMSGRNQDSGIQQLPKGEWQTLLHLIDHCGFWWLPVDDSHFEDQKCPVDDGDFLSITGRDSERYHDIHRFVWREAGLDAVLNFGRRVSGLFRSQDGS